MTLPFEPNCANGPRLEESVIERPLSVIRCAAAPGRVRSNPNAFLSGQSYGQGSRRTAALELRDGRLVAATSGHPAREKHGAANDRFQSTAAVGQAPLEGVRSPKQPLTACGAGRIRCRPGVRSLISRTGTADPKAALEMSAPLSRQRRIQRLGAALVRNVKQLAAGLLLKDHARQVLRGAVAG